MVAGKGREPAGRAEAEEAAAAAAAARFCSMRTLLMRWKSSTYSQNSLAAPALICCLNRFTCRPREGDHRHVRPARYKKREN